MSLGSRTTIETMMMALPHTQPLKYKKKEKNWERKEEASLA